MKKIIVAAACCLSLCFLGAYLSGCAKEIGTDGFVRVRQEVRTTSGVTSIFRPALYQKRQDLGVGKPTYRVSATGGYEPFGTLNETD